MELEFDLGQMMCIFRVLRHTFLIILRSQEGKFSLGARVLPLGNITEDPWQHTFTFTSDN